MHTQSSQSLSNQLLIAMPQLSTGIFKSSVTYICEHNDEGAMGIIINRPSSLALADVLEDLGENAERLPSRPILVGGPVGMERGFVLHDTAITGQQWRSTLQVTDDIALTGSRDILSALARGDGPENYLVALGYAGWDAGQLEDELSQNAWLTSPASADILFNTPFEQRAKVAARQLGIDLAALSAQSGNA